jgi:hypothetical protein
MQKLRMAANRNTTLGDRGRTASGRAGIASNRRFVTTQQGDAEHRNKQRDAKYTRAIHSRTSYLQVP